MAKLNISKRCTPCILCVSLHFADWIPVLIHSVLFLRIKETEEQIEARINKWDKFLDDQEEAEEKAKKEGEVKKNPEGEASTAET